MQTGTSLPALAQAPQDLEAVEVGHRQVEQHDRGCDRLDRRERGAAAGGRHDAEALELEALGDGAADRVVVVDEQDDGRAVARGVHRWMISQSAATSSRGSARTVSRPGPQVTLIASAAAHGDGVVAGAADDDVAAAAAGDAVVAGAAEQRVVAGAAVERVAPGVAGEQVVAGAAEEAVVAAAAADAVVAAAAVDRVRAAGAVDAVGSVGARSSSAASAGAAGTARAQQDGKARRDAWVHRCSLRAEVRASSHESSHGA